MPSIVWLNGNVIDPADARVSAFDAGFQHALGLFETMHATRGRVFRVEHHLARLARSARELGLSDSLRTRALEEAVQRALDASELGRGDEHARVRLTLSGGDLNLLNASRHGAETTGYDPTILISAQPLVPYPEAMFERGVGAMIASAKANPFDPTGAHKTLNYWWRLRALQQAAQAGLGEALVLSVTNHVCSGAVSSLVIIKDDALLLPLAHGEEPSGSLPQPVLPGVTRRVILDAAEAEDRAITKRLVTIDDILDADELFLTNSSWGVLPVVRVEQRAIGTGEPGPVTQTLRERWLEMLRHEG